MEQHLKVLKVEVSTLRNLRYIRSLPSRKVGVCRSQILGSQNLSSLRKIFHRYTVDKPTANNSHKSWAHDSCPCSSSNRDEI